MNGNGTQQLYVSTFKMNIHSPRASSSPGNGPRSVEIRPSERSTNTGKSCRGGEGGRLLGLNNIGGVSLVLEEYKKWL